MHLPDGLLPAPVCIGGYGLTGLLTWYSLRQIRRSSDPTQGVPKAALLTAAFFVASSIHLPIPPTSVHLLLNGLLGVILGFYAFPAILVGLLLQTVMLGHGGLTTLGLNALIQGIPALLADRVFSARHYWSPSLAKKLTAVFAFLAGAMGLGLSAVLFYGLVFLTLPAGLDRGAEQAAILVLLLAHIPLAGIEGGITCLIVLFLQRVKPQLLENGV